MCIPYEKSLGANKVKARNKKSKPNYINGNIKRKRNYVEQKLGKETTAEKHGSKRSLSEILRPVCVLEKRG